MYGVDDSGLVWSRVTDAPAMGAQCVAVPVLEYEKIGQGGDFSKPLTYRLERMDITALIHAPLRWTRKIPLHIKNVHRQFWGMKPLAGE